jgi:2'-5' RNA ligase
MNKISDSAPFGSAAVVSYIPDPLGSYLNWLRGSLPGEHNPQAHLTILPPRRLAVPVERASEQARQTLERFSTFSVELASVRVFPGTNVLYVELGEGDSLVRRLHAALNSGDLAAIEQFEFLPHLTISGPIAAEELPRMRRQAENAWHALMCPRRFTLSEIVFLWLKPGSSNGDWIRVWSHKLKHASAASATLLQG